MKREQRDWDKLYAQYKKSNLSIVDFAKRNNISSASAYKQFKKRSSQEDNSMPSKEFSFIPISVSDKKEETTVTEESSVETKIIIESGTYKIHVPARVDEHSLKSVLQIIGDIC